MCELVEELSVPVRTGLEQASPLSDPQASGLVIMPSVGEGDELVGYILERLLGAEGISSALLPWKCASPRAQFSPASVSAGGRQELGWRSSHELVERPRN